MNHEIRVKPLFVCVRTAVFLSYCNHLGLSLSMPGGDVDVLQFICHDSEERDSMPKEESSERMSVEVAEVRLP